jgi:hypothetical protein
MPKFQGKLTDEEIRQTVAYVCSRPSAQPNAARTSGARHPGAVIRTLPLFPLPASSCCRRRSCPCTSLRIATGPRCPTRRGDRTIGMAMEGGRRTFRPGDLPVGGAGDRGVRGARRRRFNIVLLGRFATAFWRSRRAPDIHASRASRRSAAPLPRPQRPDAGALRGPALDSSRVLELRCPRGPSAERSPPRSPRCATPRASIVLRRTRSRPSSRRCGANASGRRA